MATPRQVKPRWAPGPVLALLGTLAIAGSAAAGPYGFGSAVGKSDFDYTPMPSMKPGLLCMRDLDGSGLYNPGEPLYLLVETDSHGGALACDRVSYKDIRVLPPDGLKAGTEVALQDPDHAVLYHPAPVEHRLRFFDKDPDSKFKAKDTLYIDVFYLGTPRADYGDLRLTAYGKLAPGSVVANEDPDVPFPLADLKGGGVTFATANALFKAGDTWYVNADVAADTVVEDSDVRLLAKAPNPFDGLGSTPALPDVRVVAFEAPASVVAGVPFQARITVQNGGKGTGAGAVETTFGGEVVDVRGTPPIEPGKTAVLVLTLVATAPGQTLVAAGDASATIVVAAPADPTAGLAARVQALERQLELAQRGLQATQAVTSDLDDRVRALEPDEALSVSSVAEARAETPAAPAALAVLLILGVALLGTRARRLR